jgi:hypothetical protein
VLSCIVVLSPGNLSLPDRSPRLLRLRHRCRLVLPLFNNRHHTLRLLRKYV